MMSISSLLVIVLLFLIVDAVDSALEFVVVTQPLESIFYKFRVVLTNLIAHPVEVEVVVAKASQAALVASTRAFLKSKKSPLLGADFDLLLAAADMA